MAAGSVYVQQQKKISTAILDFISKQGYFGGTIAMMPPKYPCLLIKSRIALQIFFGAV